MPRSDKWERRLVGSFPRVAGLIGFTLVVIWATGPGEPATVMTTYMALTALVAFAYDLPMARLPPRGQRHDVEHVAAGVVPLLLWRLAGVPLAAAIAIGAVIRRHHRAAAADAASSSQGVSDLRAMFRAGYVAAGTARDCRRSFWGVALSAGEAGFATLAAELGQMIPTPGDLARC